VLQQLKRCARNCARDEGVAGVIIAMIIAIAAFSALAVFMSRYIGPSRDLERVQTAEAKLAITRDALLVYFNQQTAKDLPCPDTDLDGHANSPCTGTGTVSGTLPWRTMGIGRQDAIDGYGRYYTYVVSATAAERAVCDSVTNYYDTSQVDYPGSSTDATSLELRTSSEAAGTGTFVRFAVISHGPNGLGGTTENGTAMPDPVAGSDEFSNAGANPTSIITGPYNEGTGTAYFDDAVMYDSDKKLDAACEDLTASGQKNTSINEDFDAAGSFAAGRWATDGGGSPPTQTGGQAEFTATTSYLATLATANFAPVVRPIYVSTLWTPDAANVTSGFSIVTRATISTLVSGDMFGTGVTFRFYSTGAAAGTNAITIRDSTTTHATSAAEYSLIPGQQYLIEAFDDGASAWGRISQVANPSNAAEVIDTSLTVDLTGDQRVLFVNGPGTNRIDDAILGVPMLSALTGPTDGFVSSADGTNDTTANLSLEAWIRPRAVPSSGTIATIVSQWDTTDLANSGFRLYLDGTVVTFAMRSDAGGTQAVPLGITASANEWIHVAATYDSATNTVRGYRNGVLTSTTVTTTATGAINEGSVEFVVGADTMTSNTAASNFFYGNISDVRVWNDVRTSAEIARCDDRRLGGTNCPTGNLVVNWKLDPTAIDGGISSSVAATYGAIGTAGTLRDGAYYAPSLGIYFRPNANEVCPESARVSSYECAFRDVADTVADGVFTPPSDLPAIFVKAWAGGGGGNDEGGDPGNNYGGGAAFARGLVPNSGTWDITLGAGGAGTAAADADDGTATTIDVGATTMFDIPPGTGAGNNPDNADGNGGNINNGDVDAAVLNDDIADGEVSEAGCIPASDPCTDPHYGPTYLNLSLRLPGRGGVLGDFTGRAGAVILIW